MHWPKTHNELYSISVFFILDNVSKNDFFFPYQGDSGQFDPQTEADRAAQKCIIGSLLKIYPTLQIIGEEEVCPIFKDIVVAIYWLR